MNKANLSCEACYEFFQKKKKPTPCESCKKPVLMHGNLAAWEIFEDTTQQLRIGGMGGVFGFEFSALPLLFSIHSLPEDEWYVTLKKLTVIYSVALKIWNTPPPKQTTSP